MTDIASLRREYSNAPLDLEHVCDEPFTQFRRWFDEARAVASGEVNAMTLATVSPDGAPSARVVLLKDLDPRGFVFYTNRLSRKGIELDTSPRCALCFLWEDLARQVRVEGDAERVDDATADAYFASRPRGSQLGAWASPQSEVVASREALDARLAELTRRFEGAEVTRPPHWGGYRVVPRAVEFWQGRQSRLHDRLRYTRAGDRWRLERLAP